MKQIIAAFFANLGIASFVGFGGSKVKTVDNVLLTFTKTLDALKEVEAQERAVAAKALADKAEANTKYYEAVVAADFAFAKADLEATRAAVAIDRFSKLVAGV